VDAVNVSAVADLITAGRNPGGVHGPRRTPTGVLHNLNADTRGVGAGAVGAWGAAEAGGADRRQWPLRRLPDESTLVVADRRRRAGEAAGPGLSAGMVPKMEACLRAVPRRGVYRRPHVVDGRVGHSTLLEVFTSEGFGDDGVAVMSGFAGAAGGKQVHDWTTTATPPLALVRGEGRGLVWGRGRTVLCGPPGAAIRGQTRWDNAHPGGGCRRCPARSPRSGTCPTCMSPSRRWRLAELLLALVGRPGRVVPVQLRRGGERGGPSSCPGATGRNPRRGGAGRLPRPDHGRAPRADRAAGQGPTRSGPLPRRRHARTLRWTSPRWRRP